MAEHDGDDIGPALRELAAAFAMHVLQLQPVLLQLQKAPVDIEQIGRPQVSLIDQFSLCVA